MAAVQTRNPEPRKLRTSVLGGKGIYLDVLTLHIYRNLEEMSIDHGTGKQNSANITVLLKIKVFTLHYLVDKMIIAHKVILIKATLQIYFNFIMVFDKVFLHTYKHENKVLRTVSLSWI